MRHINNDKEIWRFLKHLLFSCYYCFAIVVGTLWAWWINYTQIKEAQFYGFQSYLEIYPFFLEGTIMILILMFIYVAIINYFGLKLKEKLKIKSIYDEIDELFKFR